MTMSITDLRPGDVYALKDGEANGLHLQVGVGTDVGVFPASTPDDVTTGVPRFRVLMNQSDVRRLWAKVGPRPLNPLLAELAWYGDADIGVEQKFMVRLDNVDDRTPIDDARFQGLERLAVWETVHVLRRIGR